MGDPSQALVGCIDEGALTAFAEGVADETVQNLVEKHLAECADCRAVLTRLATILHSHVGRSSTPGGIPVLVEDTLRAGTPVGRYIVEGLIGRGAMGTVYAARDPDLDRTVALKLLRSESLSERARQKVRARLLREAKAMARLSHPGVITVHDVGAFGEQLFVAMEYVDGGTLRQWRGAAHRSYREIVAVYERAGSGLAAAHEAGLVHRDFKPDNVLVGRDGRVRVTDFGLARTVDAEPLREPAHQSEGASEGGTSTTLTRTGTLLGTPAYMPPEQLRGKPADTRSDVFSFCVALYEALYGERPFAGRSVRDLRSAIEDGKVRAAPLMSGVPGWLRAVLLRGLEAAPERRFPSMRELLDAMRAGYASHWRRVAGVVVIATSVLGLAATAEVVALRGIHVVARREPSAATAASTEQTPPAASPRQPPVPSRSAAAVTAPVDESAVGPAAFPAAPARRSPSPAPPAPRPSKTREPIGPAAPLSDVPLVGRNGALILE